MHRLPQKIKQLAIPGSIFRSTISKFQEIGEQQKEAIAYWTGTLNQEKGEIRNVIFADSYNEFENEKLFARVPLQTTFQIGKLIHERNEVLFAQIHSHPFEAFHSFTDDNYPISHKLGFLSIIVPFFGKNVSCLTDCKVYEYEGNAK